MKAFKVQAFFRPILEAETSSAEHNPLTDAHFNEPKVSTSHQCVRWTFSQAVETTVSAALAWGCRHHRAAEVPFTIIKLKLQGETIHSLPLNQEVHSFKQSPAPAAEHRTFIPSSLLLCKHELTKSCSEVSSSPPGKSAGAFCRCSLWQSKVNSYFQPGKAHCHLFIISLM